MIHAKLRACERVCAIGIRSLILDHASTREHTVQRCFVSLMFHFIVFCLFSRVALPPQNENQTNQRKSTRVETPQPK